MGLKKPAVAPLFWEFSTTHLPTYGTGSIVMKSLRHNIILYLLSEMSLRSDMKIIKILQLNIILSVMRQRRLRHYCFPSLYKLITYTTPSNHNKYYTFICIRTVSMVRIYSIYFWELRWFIYVWFLIKYPLTFALF